MKRAMSFGLTTSTEDESKSFGKGEQVMMDYELAMRIMRAGPDDVLDLSVEEAARIKEKVGRVWVLFQPIIGVQVYGFIAHILDEKNNDFKVLHGNGVSKEVVDN